MKKNQKHQKSCASQPREFNELVINDLYRGQTVLNMILDKPTMMGIDPDHPSVLHVGVKGVSISTLNDLEVAFHDLMLEALPIYINTGVNPIPITALMGAYCRKNEQDVTQMKGVLGFDPLGELAKHGKLSTTLKASYDMMADVLKWVNREGAEMRTILVESPPNHNGIDDVVQELAYAISAGVEYLREMIHRGFNIEAIAPKIAFSFSLGSNFSIEISKLRAARLLWSKIIEIFGGGDSDQKMYLYGKIPSWAKTSYDAYVNMLRSLSEEFSETMTDVDSLILVPFDELMREADEFSGRASENVQTTLQDECHFTQSIDPTEEFRYIESLTHEIAQSAWKIFQEAEGDGEMKIKLSKGEIQAAVSPKNEERFKNMPKCRHLRVGMSVYSNRTEEKLELWERDYNRLRAARATAVQEYRKGKDLFQIGAYLSRLGDHYCLTGQISMEYAIEAVLHGATLGDIADICYRFTNEDERKGGF